MSESSQRRSLCSRPAAGDAAYPRMYPKPSEQTRLGGIPEIKARQRGNAAFPGGHTHDVSTVLPVRPACGVPLLPVASPTSTP